MLFTWRFVERTHIACCAPRFGTAPHAPGSWHSPLFACVFPPDHPIVAGSSTGHAFARLAVGVVVPPSAGYRISALKMRATDASRPEAEPCGDQADGLGSLLLPVHSEATHHSPPRVGAEKWAIA